MNKQNRSSKKLYYSDIHHSENYLNRKKAEIAGYKTFAAADRTKLDNATNAAEPSDEAVKELRDWSEENRQ